MKLGIVAIGYNRADAMERLLNALQGCEYGKDEVLLVISVDKWEQDDVERCAEQFEWNHGRKVVKTFEQRQGLRQHIIMCGSYMDEYELDAIAVFEDDIVPSVDFYQFMKQSVAFYCKEEQIAGIALYSYQWNPIANKPFCPMQGNGSVYLSRFAVSWGQIWLRKQWNHFVRWYEQIEKEGIEGLNIPQSVKEWKNSWLKYHIAYCEEQNKYFVYPYRSLATCCAEQGVHTSVRLNQYQVPVAEETGTSYQFIPVSQINVRYDTFFESEYLYDFLLKKGYDTCIDLYELKNQSQGKRYLLTGKEEAYSIVESYGLSLKPHEKNILTNVPGDELFLYDTYQAVNNIASRSFSIEKFLYYFNGSIDKRVFLHYFKSAMKDKMARKKKS